MNNNSNIGNSKKYIILVIICGAILILANVIYNNKNNIEKWVVCDYVGNLSGLEETIKFRYVSNRMYGYYETRTLDIPDKDNHEKALENIKKFGEEFELSDDLQYSVEDDGRVIKTKFYIKALEYYIFINEYFKEKEITNESSMQDVIDKMGNDFVCVVK